jgi:hypothetical protein
MAVKNSTTSVLQLPLFKVEAFPSVKDIEANVKGHFMPSRISNVCETTFMCILDLLAYEKYTLNCHILRRRKSA